MQGRALGCQAANRGAGQTAADFAHAYDVGAMAAARRLSTFLRNTAHCSSATGHLRPSWHRQQQWPQEARHIHRGLRGSGLPACAESGERARGWQARVVNVFLDRVVHVFEGSKVTSQASCPPGVGSRCGGARGSAPADGPPPSPRTHTSADLVRLFRVSRLASLAACMQEGKERLAHNTVECPPEPGPYACHVVCGEHTPLGECMPLDVAGFRPCRMFRESCMS